ncbi:MAG TPA: WYL domain-containing protein [Actinomycetota bacterium]
MAPADKAERLLDLVILLLSASRPLTVSEIRERIPGYGQHNEESFHRMFERDKAELRDIGLPLEQQETLAGPGYRVRAREALLDDPGLTVDEQAALALAARVWEGRDASSGWLKLAAISGATGEGPEGFVLPRVTLTPEAATVLDAVARRKRVSFRYRTAAGEVRDREVEPYGLVLRRGQWYLTGRDVDADGSRHFKIGRVEGTITIATGTEPDFDPPPPGGIDAPRAPWEGEEAEHARISFSPDTAWSVQRRAGVGTVGERDGSVELLVPFSDLPSFASWIAGFGERALVLEPADLRDAVIGRLRALAGSEPHGG